MQTEMSLGPQPRNNGRKKSSASELSARGCVVEDGYISGHECERLLESIKDHSTRTPAAEINRPAPGRPLIYSVIDGRQINAGLPEIVNLYERVRTDLKLLWDGELVPLDDDRAACNINITKPGGMYRWHYDRNLITAILYLNGVTGGETECYPEYRITLRNNRAAWVQKPLDRLLQTRPARFLSGKRMSVSPAPGRLLVMKGRTCLHSVAPVIEGERFNVIMSFDKPGAVHSVAGPLNDYLYAPETVSAADPNYPTS